MELYSLQGLNLIDEHQLLQLQHVILSYIQYSSWTDCVVAPVISLHVCLSVSLCLAVQ